MYHSSSVLAQVLRAQPAASNKSSQCLRAAVLALAAAQWCQCDVRVVRNPLPRGAMVPM